MNRYNIRQPRRVLRHVWSTGLAPGWSSILEGEDPISQETILLRLISNEA